jgi:hypothetical protein
VTRNVPPLEQRIERLEREVKAMREALARVMGAVLPAFHTLEQLEEAARSMAKLDQE